MPYSLIRFASLLVTGFVLQNTAWAKTPDTSNNFIIEAYGGSSTLGAMAVRENGKQHNINIKDNEIALINKWLGEKYGPGIRVVNKGAASAQAMDLLHPKYFYKKNKSWREEMQRSPAKIILLNFATNDARHFHFKDTEAKYIVSPDQYTKVMTELIAIAREDGIAGAAPDLWRGKKVERCALCHEAGRTGARRVAAAGTPVSAYSANERVAVADVT